MFVLCSVPKYIQHFVKVVCEWRQCTLHVFCYHQWNRIRKGSIFIEFTDLDLYSEYGPRIKVLKLHFNFANCMRKRPQKLSANSELCEKGWGRSQIVGRRESLVFYKSFNTYWCIVIVRHGISMHILQYIKSTILNFYSLAILVHCILVILASFLASFSFPFGNHRPFLLYPLVLLSSSVRFLKGQ
jgi:hypothetical protein